MKHLQLFLLSLLVSVFGLCGCATISGHRVQPEAVEFIQPTITTKAEVIENLGQPTMEYASGSVFAYIWGAGHYETASEHQADGWRRPPFGPNKENEEKVLGPFRTTPSEDFGSTTGSTSPTVDNKQKSFCVAFDSAGRVTKSGYVSASPPEPFETTVLRWSGSNVVVK